MKPTPVALGLVRLSTRLLPAGETRQRYRWDNPRLGGYGIGGGDAFPGG